MMATLLTSCWLALMRRGFCESNGAFVLAIIGIGSFVEKLLYFVLTERDQQFRTRGLGLRNGKWLRPDRVSLEQLLLMAHDKGLIQMDAHEFAQKSVSSGTSYTYEGRLSSAPR